MKMNVILKTVGMAVFTALLTIGQASGQTQASTSTQQQAAGQILNNILVNASQGTTPLAIYPPGYIATRQAMGDAPYPPAPPATMAGAAMKAYRRMSGNGMMQPNSQTPVVQSYAVIDLNPSSGNQSYAYGINNSGTVVGSFYASSGTEYAFEYYNNQMYDISQVTAGNFFSQAIGINNNGVIVGHGNLREYGGGDAMRYANGTVEDLSQYLECNSYANAVNSSGQVAGYCYPSIYPEIINKLQSNQNSDPCNDAFLLTGSVSEDLGTIDGFSGSAAYGVNDSSLVVGYSWGTVNGQYTAHAFSYVGGGPMVDLDNALGGNGYSQAYGVNNSGQIVGVTYDAFIYDTTSGQYTDLGALGDEVDNYSTGYGINNNGVAVGTVYIGSINDNHAFVYSGVSMQDLNNLIDPAYGWDLQYATAINDSGQIVGYGVNSQGQTHAFLLDPITPCPGWTIDANGIAGNGFHQGDFGVSGTGVPQYYGNPNAYTPGVDNPNCFDPVTERAMTRYYGCALCSVATMLTSIPGLELMTPSILDAYLTSPGINGYSKADINWAEIPNLPALQSYSISLVDSRSISDLATLDAYLQDHVCGHGDRVILHFYTDSQKDSHYVLVTGQNGSDWKLFDPGWVHAYNTSSGASEDGDLSSLAAHLRGFTTHSLAGNSIPWTFTIASVRTYRVGTGSSANLSGVVHSPVEILATDPGGERVGYDPVAGTDVFEIPGASYVRDYPIADSDANASSTGDPDGIKTFYVPSPSGGNYQVQLTGTASGSYTFDLSTYWPGSGGQVTQTTTGTTDVGVTITNQTFVKVPPIISGCSVGVGAFNFSFTSQSNVTYSIEGASSLGGAGWVTLQTLTATDTTTAVSQAMTNDAMFFRVLAQ